ncbi:MAG: flippase-like domain-containing protein [Chitinivibrionales bacterium]|nr:flippase-like domain-containing protein [Chitinivibrionales bacterium]
MKNIALQGGKLLITAAVCLWIVKKYGFETITSLLISAQPLWWGSGIAIFLVSVFLGTYQWFLILTNKKVVISFLKTLKFYFIGIFLYNTVLGFIAGDAYKLAALHYDSNGGKASVAATFIDRLANLLALSLFAMAGGLIILVNNLQQGKEFIKVLGVLALFGSIFLTIFLLVISHRLQQLFRSWSKFLPESRFKSLFLAIMEEIYLNRRNRTDRTLVLHVFYLSISIQVLRVLVHVFAAAALGMFSYSTVHYFFVIVPVTALLMLIPLPFGILQVIGGMLFSMAGFDTTQAIVMEFLAALIGISGSLFGGLLFISDTTTFSEKKSPQPSTSAEPISE